jgi:hypothetical protein
MSAQNKTWYASGTVFLDDLDANNQPVGHLVKMTGASSIAIKPNSKSLTDISKDDGTRGMVSAQIFERDLTDFTLTVKGANKEKMKMQLMGTDSVINRAENTVTGEELTAMGDDYLIPLAHDLVKSNLFTLTNEAGTTTYVLGTDYTVDYNAGHIQTMGGTIAANTALKANYGYKSAVGYKIAGDTVLQWDKYFKFIGSNLADKEKRFKFEVPKLTITADAAFDFLDEKLPEMKFKGTPILLDEAPSAYTFEYIDTLGA